MARRLILMGLAATSMAVPAAAHTALPAQTGLATIQHAQSAYYSVRNVQELLNRLGYDAGPADGIMGSRTQAAIMAYQRDRGLSVTGAADAELYAHMLEAAGGAATASGATTATTGTTTTTPGTTVITSGQTVVDVQTELRRRGYDIPAITGQWDVPTRDAVLAYQRDAGLTQTGYIDASLAQALGTSTTASVDQRELVRDIQVALSSRGYNVGPADGTMSPLTQTAIRTYEADAGLPVTGTASAALLARLEGEAGTGGMSGTATVTAVQDELIARGYLDGEADGVMGAATSAAVRQFQQDAGLEVTGVADETLLARLRATDLTRRDANREQIAAEIERLLQAKGYRVGPVDGVVDAQTQLAIRAFQEDAGLEVTGRADGELLGVIRGSEVTAAPLTPEQAVQGIVQGATTRLLESLANPAQQPAE